MSSTQLEAITQTSASEGTIGARGTKNDDASAVTFPDSGYGSTSTTPSTTPNQKLLPGQKGRNFLRGVPTLFSRRNDSNKRKTPFFNLELDSMARDRFKTIQPHFERLLRQHVETSQKPGAYCAPMACRIVMMGTSTADATPHIVVFCTPEHKSLVKRFAKQDTVKDLCQPTDLGIPAFKVAVIDRAPRPRLNSEVIAESWTGNPVVTHCGLPIIVMDPSGQPRNATLGGVIKVVTKTGDIELYGITAGHLLQPLVDGPERGHESDEESNDERGQESDGESEDDSDVEFGIMADDSEHKAVLESWYFKAPTVVGGLAHSADVKISLQNSPDGRERYYDWALFHLSNYMENRLTVDTKAKIALSNKQPGDTGRRSIYMVSASTGIKTGELLPEPGSIVLRPGQELVATHIINIDDGQSGKHLGIGSELSDKLD